MDCKRHENIAGKDDRSNPCLNCGAPAHPSTGWVFKSDPSLVLLCGRCAKEFSKWYMSRTRNPITIEAQKDRTRRED